MLQFDGLFRVTLNLEDFTIEHRQITHLNELALPTQMTTDHEPRVPLLVVWLVVFHLADELNALPPVPHYSLMTYDEDYGSDTGALLSMAIDIISTLKALSLVHRTWTPIAQQVVRQRVRLTDRNITAYVQNVHPSCDEGARHLHFSCGEWLSRRVEIPEETRSDFSLLVSRMPNLRSLQVAIIHNLPAGPSITVSWQSFIGTIVRLTSLKVLQLGYKMGRVVPCVGSLCMALPSLVHLERLEIYNWIYDGVLDPWTPPSDRSSESLPPANLKTIIFSFCGHCRAFVPPDIARWLFEARGSYSLRKLKCIVERQADIDKCISPVLRYALPTLESLGVRFMESHFKYSTHLGGLLRQCSESRLRRFIWAVEIPYTDGELENFLLEVQPGIETLVFVFPYFKDPDPEYRVAYEGLKSDIEKWKSEGSYNFSLAFQTENCLVCHCSSIRQDASSPS